VTGATGFIGYEVARRLSDLGLRPRLLVRRPLRGPLVAGLEAEPIQGDLERPESLARAVRGVDTIIHLAARAIFEEYDIVRPTIVDGSAAVMRAAVEEGVERFVYASSMLVYDGQAGFVDAATPTTSCLGYGRAKREAERALTLLAAGSGTKLAIVRLPHVYGATDLMFEQMRRGRIISPGSGRNRFAHLHVADAARLLIGAAEKDWSGATPVADDEPASWREFFAVVRTYYPRFRQVSLPRWLALGGTRALTPLRRLRAEPSLYTPDAVISWNLELKVKPRLLWDELGLEPLHPTIREGIPAVLDDCIAFRWVHPVLDRS
jgi:nucleoside-diphosphate-sugar epimerase